MRKLLLTAVLAGVTIFASGLSSQAQASHDWLAVGSVFRVGVAHIAFALGRPVYGYEPSYYYRYDQPIRYRGHNCSRHCFHDAGYYYHHQSCPVVATHFSHYGVDPYWAFDRYAPRYSHGDGGHYDRHDYGYGDRYGRYDRYDDDDRYRRGDSYRRHDRYDRYDRHDHDRGHRGHGRGHRHHEGCGHH
jgi:hypothetical protein